MVSDKKKIIIFDMDGVLFDSIPFARQAFMEMHPGITEEIYNEIHSGNFHQEAAKYTHLMTEESEAERNRRYQDYAEKKSKSKMFNGMKDFLFELHNQGHVLVLNSNAHDRNCIPLLENAGIANLFDLIAAAGVSKDKVEKFRIISDRYKSGNNEMLFITDALGDLRDADEAGVPTVVVTWGVHDKTYFEREKHDNLISIVSTVDDLKHIVQNSF